MSTLRTNNLQNPDSAGVNIVMTEGGGSIFSGIVTAPTLNVTDGSVGIGTNSPADTLVHLHKSSTSGFDGILLTNSTTGVTTSGGFTIGLNDSEQGRIWHYGNESIQFGVDNELHGTLRADGRWCLGPNQTSGSKELNVFAAAGPSAEFHSDSDAGISIKDNSDSSIVEITNNNGQLTIDLDRSGQVTTEAFIIEKNGGSSGTVELFRVNSDGDVKIKSFGNASNASADALQIGKTDNNYGITILSATNAQGRIDFTDTEDTNDPQGKIAYYHDSNSLQFFTNGSAASNERLRIASTGCLQVGEPSGTPTEVMQIRKASSDTEIITYANTGYKTIFNCTGSNRFALERGGQSIFEIQDPNGNGERSDLRFDGNIILNHNIGEVNNSAVQAYRLIGCSNVSLASGMTILGNQTDTMSTKAARITTSNNSGTAFFGPYGAMHPGSYTAMFHMKVSNNSNTSTFLRIDVSGSGITDAGGYGVHRPRALNLAPSHFDNSDRYQYIGLDFNFVNPVGSNVIEVRGLNYNNGRGADLYLDHILIVPRIPSHDG